MTSHEVPEIVNEVKEADERRQWTGKTDIPMIVNVWVVVAYARAWWMICPVHLRNR